MFAADDRRADAASSGLRRRHLELELEVDGTGFEVEVLRSHDGSETTVLGVTGSRSGSTGRRAAVARSIPKGVAASVARRHPACTRACSWTARWSSSTSTTASPTSRAYPVGPDADGVRIRLADGARLISCAAYELHPATNRERPTENAHPPRPLDLGLWPTEADEPPLDFLMAPISLGDPDLRHQNARIGHAVSADLRAWEFLGEALGPGRQGRGLPRHLDGQRDPRRRRLADVLHRSEPSRRRPRAADRAREEHRPAPLEKDDGFALEVDERWYEQLDLDVWFDLTWRDPWVYFDEAAGEYRMLLTARAREGAVDSRGVIGLARSRTLDDWEVLPPIASPGEFGHMEVPQLERIGDRWYLFFSAYEWAHSAQRVDAGLALCGTHYLVADTPSGPLMLESQDFLSGDPRGELYAGRVVRTIDGEHVFLAFLQFVDDGPFVGGLSDPFPITVDARPAVDRT